MHLTLKRYRNLVGRALVSWAFLCQFILWFAFFLLMSISYFGDQGFVLTVSPVQLQSIEGNRINLVREKAKLIVDDIEQRYPPNASGWSRILPWNWSVEPVIPADKVKVFEKIQSWNGNNRNFYDPVNNLTNLEEIVDLSTSEKVEELQSAIRALEEHLPKPEEIVYVKLFADDSGAVFVSFILAFQPFAFSVLLAGSSFWKKGTSTKILFAMFFQRSDNLEEKESIILDRGAVVFLLCLSTLFVMTDYMTPLIPYALGIGTILCLGIGFTLIKLRWPHNPLISAVDDVIPSEKVDE